MLLIIVFLLSAIGKKTEDSQLEVILVLYCYLYNIALNSFIHVSGGLLIFIHRIRFMRDPKWKTIS